MRKSCLLRGDKVFGGSGTPWWQSMLMLAGRGDVIARLGGGRIDTLQAFPNSIFQLIRYQSWCQRDWPGAISARRKQSVALLLSSFTYRAGLGGL